MANKYTPKPVSKHDPAALFNSDGEPYATVWQMRRIRAMNLCRLADGTPSYAAQCRLGDRITEELHHDGYR